MTQPREESFHDVDRPESISWLELFFDLVVVAAVAVLTEGLLADPTLGTVGLLILMYGAIWMSWVMVALYANVARGQTRTAAVVLAMFLIALMVSTAPIHHPERANLFTGAFLLLRTVISGNAMRTGKLLASWPLLQFGGAIAPWIVSLWFDEPTKYYLWAVGLVLDLVMVMLRGGFAPDQIVKQMTARSERSNQRRDEGRRRGGAGADRSTRGGPAGGVTQWVAVDVDRSHLDERLGLFMIIVLGEAVTQLVLAAATKEWTSSFESTALTGFGLLIGLWWLTFVYGFAGAPHSEFADLAPRFGLPLHLLSTLGLVGVAAGLGEMVHAPEPLPAILRWVLCGGLALHFAVGTVCGLAGQAGWLWVIFWGAASTGYAVVFGIVGGELVNPTLGWVLLAPVLWQAAYGLVKRHVSS